MSKVPYTKAVSKHLDASVRVLFLHHAEPVHLKRMKRQSEKQKVPSIQNSPPFARIIRPKKGNKNSEKFSTPSLDWEKAHKAGSTNIEL